MGGITITDARCETMLMGDGYLANGKTILCRTEDSARFRSLEDIDRPEVRVMVNPGGTNELFAREHLTHATLLVHQSNEEIPTLIAEGEADVMITEITHGEIGVLMRRGQEDLLLFVNHVIAQMKADGTLRALIEKYEGCLKSS